MAKWLTKTDYVMRYLVSPAYLWIAKHEKEKLPEVDAGLQHIFDQGHRVNEVAHKLFEGGTLIPGRTLDALEPTRVAMEHDDVIFEAAVLAEERIYCQSDIIKRNGEVWDLYEIKSSTKPKVDHFVDLAFQRLVWEKAGHKIGKQLLVLVNRQYVKDGPIDPARELHIVDVTVEVENFLSRTEEGMKEALKIIDLPECPDTSPLACNNLEAWLPIYAHLTGGLPDESIYHLSRMSLQTFRTMDRLGYKRVSDIVHPDQFKLSVNQRGFWQAAVNKAPTIHHQKIEHFLSNLKFPLYFFDYETIMPAIPLYDGTRPYDQTPFQYSLHILDEPFDPAQGKPGAKLRHRAFLHQASDNPMPALVKQLKEDIGPTGTVLAWNKSFEARVNDELAYKFPSYAPLLKSINSRLVDLKDVFAQQYYVDAKFKASASLKAVLPVLVPELSYESLAIGEGGVASMSWEKIARGETKGAEADQVYKDLEEYCAQDTLAMVKIYEFLVELCKNRTAELPF